MKSSAKAISVICIVVFSGNVFGQDLLGEDYETVIREISRISNVYYEPAQQLDKETVLISGSDYDDRQNFTGFTKNYFFKLNDGEWILVMEEHSGGFSDNISENYFISSGLEKTNYYYTEEVAENIYKNISVYYKPEKLSMYDYSKPYYKAAANIKMNDGSFVTKFRYYLDNKYLEKKSAETGNIAPDFSAPDPNGKNVTLYNSLGKYTILHFWASWSKPDQAENANLLSIYKSFHGKGLNMIGVSLDKDRESWKAAISSQGLIWTQVSNIQFWHDPVAQLYNIKSIPFILILDENGKVIKTDVREDELKKYINTLFE